GRQAHGEDRVGDARVALGDRGVADRERRRGVVGGDRAHALSQRDRRVGRVTKVDGELLGELVDRVADDRYGNRLRRGARREGQRAARLRVVARAQGRAVGGGEPPWGRQGGPAEQAHGEDRAGGPDVALGDLGRVDDQSRRRVVVEDGPRSARVGQGRVDRVAQDHQEG